MPTFAMTRWSARSRLIWESTREIIPASRPARPPNRLRRVKPQWIKSILPGLNRPHFAKAPLSPHQTKKIPAFYP